jgi:hypothetical protein
MMKSLIVIGAAVLFSATAAMAQQRGPAGACAADIKVKCAGVQPGEGRLSACVKEHLTEFSEPCQVRLAKIATSSARARIEAGTSMPVRRGILRDVLSTPKADSQPESRNVRFSNRPFGVKRKPALGPIGDYFDNFIA